MNPSKILFIVCFSSILAIPVYAEKSSTKLGVLSFPGPRTENTDTTVIRFGFVRNKKWEILDSKTLPSEAQWDLAFDGKNLGKIDSVKNNSEFHSAQGSHRVITNIEKIKKFSNPNKSFSTWSGLDRYRPMIVISNGLTADPEKWKPLTDKTSVDLAKNNFLKTLTSITLCDEKTYEEIGKLKLTAQQISLIKSYKNTKGETILGLKLPDYWKTTKCDGEPSDEFSNHWFYIKSNSVHFIGNQITPVDAGDYDGDGKSEWVFQISRYNQDGYGLFSPVDKNYIEFTWSYH